MQTVSLAMSKQLKGGQSDVLASTEKAKASGIPGPVKGVKTMGKNIINGGNKNDSGNKGSKGK